MSWPPQSQWQQQQQNIGGSQISLSNVPPPTVNTIANTTTTGAISSTPMAYPPSMPNPSAYTPAQYAALTTEQQFALQQNYQQWQTYHQQYAQWHAQYGEQYQREMQAKLGMVAPPLPFISPIPTFQPSVLPPFTAPPPLPDQNKPGSSMEIGTSAPIISQPPPPPLPYTENKIEKKFDNPPPPPSQDPKSNSTTDTQNVWQQQQQQSKTQNWWQPETQSSNEQNSLQQSNFQQMVSLFNQPPPQKPNEKPFNQQQHQNHENKWNTNNYNRNSFGKNSSENSNSNNNSSSIGPQNWKNNNSNERGQWQQQQFNNFSQQSQNQNKSQKSVIDEDEEKSHDERIFDEQFKKWEEDFENWKKQNANHPDKKAYKEYEMKFEECRRKLLDRREQMRRRKLESKMKQTSYSQGNTTNMNFNEIENKTTHERQERFDLNQQKYGADQSIAFQNKSDFPKKNETVENLQLNLSSSQIVQNPPETKMSDNIADDQNQSNIDSELERNKNQICLEDNFNLQKKQEHENEKVSNDKEVGLKNEKNDEEKTEKAIEKEKEVKIEQQQEEKVEFLKTTKAEGGGIPGLDLVPEPTEKSNNDDRVDDEVDEVIDLENESKIDRKFPNSKNFENININQYSGNDIFNKDKDMNQNPKMNEFAFKTNEDKSPTKHIPSLLDQKIEKPNFSPPRDQNSSSFGQFLNENLSSSSNTFNQGNQTRNFNNNNTSDIADLANSLSNPNVLALLTAAISNAGGDINKLLSSNTPLANILSAAATAAPNSAPTLGPGPGPAVVAPNSASLLGSGPAVAAPNSAPLLGSGPTAAATSSTSNISPWLSGQEPFNSNRSTENNFYNGPEQRNFGGFGGNQFWGNDKNNSMNNMNMNRMNSWQGGGFGGNEEFRRGNQIWNESRSRSSFGDNSNDFGSSNFGRSDLMNNRSRSNERINPLFSKDNNNDMQMMKERRSRDRNRNNRNRGRNERSDRSRSEKGNSCDRSRSSSRQGDAPPATMTSETARNPRNPFRTSEPNTFNDNLLQHETDNDYFRPAHVIDYQNRPLNDNKNIRGENTDIVLPTKVVDYGHKSQSTGNLFGNNNSDNSIFGNKDEFFPMKTIDYGHSSGTKDMDQQQQQQQQQHQGRNENQNRFSSNNFNQRGYGRGGFSGVDGSGGGRSINRSGSDGGNRNDNNGGGRNKNKNARQNRWGKNFSKDDNSTTTSTFYNKNSQNSQNNNKSNENNETALNADISLSENLQNNDNANNSNNDGNQQQQQQQQPEQQLSENNFDEISDNDSDFDETDNFSGTTIATTDICTENTTIIMIDNDKIEHKIYTTDSDDIIPSDNDNSYFNSINNNTNNNNNINCNTDRLIDNNCLSSSNQMNTLQNFNLFPILTNNSNNDHYNRNNPFFNSNSNNDITTDKNITTNAITTATVNKTNKNNYNNNNSSSSCINKKNILKKQFPSLLSSSSSSSSSKSLLSSLSRNSGSTGISSGSGTGYGSKNIVDVFVNNSNPINNKNIILIDQIISKSNRNFRPKKIVIIIRGPPGSGKTYVAKLIKDKENENNFGSSKPRLLSIDDYFMLEIDKEDKCEKTGKKIIKKEMIYEYDKNMEDKYMQYLLKSYKKTINDKLFDFIIVDCINSELKQLSEFYNYAKDAGFMPYVIDLYCDLETCLSHNIHNRSVDDIRTILSNWKKTPEYYMKLDITSLLQSDAIQEVEMEDVTDTEDNTSIKDVNEDTVEEEQEEIGNFLKSKWDVDSSENKLARLDGITKPLQKNTTTMEDYLQLNDYEQESSVSSAETGKKRVRWADIEERRAQEKLRAIGFVVGHTDWNRLMDPTGGSRALTQTKYIARVKNKK